MILLLDSAVLYNFRAWTKKDYQAWLFKHTHISILVAKGSIITLFDIVIQ